MEVCLGEGCGDHGDHGGALLLPWNSSWGPRGWGLVVLLVNARAVTGVERDVVVQEVCSWGGRRGNRVINGRIVGRGLRYGLTRVRVSEPLWVVGVAGLGGGRFCVFSTALRRRMSFAKPAQTFWTSPEKERDVSLFFFIDSGGVCVNVRLGFRMSMSVETPGSFERDRINFGAYLYL